tara:strand:+ start:1114 stop:1428 length:315 start_codon:yes stop_codon:yes gene_type:complete
MYLEIAVILLCTSLLAVWNFILIRSLATRLVLEVQALNESLGSVVERILGGEMLSNIEPINPIQALLANFIQQKIDTMPQSVAVVKDMTPEKDDLGRFKKHSEN